MYTWNYSWYYNYCTGYYSWSYSWYYWYVSPTNNGQQPPEPRPRNPPAGRGSGVSRSRHAVG